jgi:hypothetical protein
MRRRGLAWSGMKCASQNITREMRIAGTTVTMTIEITEEVRQELQR